MKKKMSIKKVPAAIEAIMWFARSGEIVRAGPFTHQMSAAQAMTLTSGLKSANFAVWPERVRVVLATDLIS